MEQRSTEWFAARCGRVTASRIADVLAKTKAGWGASRANYAAQLVAERLTGTVQEAFANEAMRWGTEKEPDARNAYSFRHDVDVEEIGFVTHPKIPMSGASPDGLVGADGLVEIKCPSTATHIETLSLAKIPDKYVLQMQWQMACTGRKWCDFVSFDPRMPETMRLFVQRLEFDDQRVGEIEREVISFIADISRKVAFLKHTYEPKLAEALIEDMAAAG